MAKRKRRKPKKLPGFEVYVTYEQCPDCGLREALDIVGRPIFDTEMGIPLTADCEGCRDENGKSTGRVRRMRIMDPMLDPRKNV